MKLGFIGAGKVGFSLGKYLKENNILIAIFLFEPVCQLLPLVPIPPVCSSASIAVFSAYCLLFSFRYV